MAQAGYTPIQLYYSITASAAPSSGNLANGELAINITDGKLYYKDNGGTVRVLAGTGGTGVVAGSNTQLQFNNNGVFGASSGLTWDGTTLTANALTVTNATTLSAGTANGVAYLNGSKVLTTGSALTFDGTTLQVSGGVGGKVTSKGTSGQTILEAVTTSNIATLESRPDISYSRVTSSAYLLDIATLSNQPILFTVNNAEQMRLTSTGLGIGTSSPTQRLHVYQSGGGTNTRFQTGITANGNFIDFYNAAGTRQAYFGSVDASGNIYVHNDANANLYFDTNNATQMTLTGSGNLGLGVTPPAYGSRAIYTGFATSASLCMSMGASGGGYGSVGYNTGITGSSNVYNYMTSDTASAIRFSSGGFHFLTAPSGTAGNAISFTQAMTLDASGRLLVGATSTLGYSEKLGIVGTIAQQGSQFNIVSGTSAQYEFVNRSASAGFDFYVNAGGTLASRIDSSGNLLVGRTSAVGKVDIQSSKSTQLYINQQTGGSTFILFDFNGATVGSITTNGVTTAYNISSDYRLKENIQPMTGALAFVRKQRPVTYNWKADGSEGAGYIAHWMQEDGAGNCVTGTKDAVDAEGKPQYQGIDTSFMVAPLNAALNELADMFDALKAEFDAYKATHP